MEEKDQKEDRFWTLVSLKLSGEATPEELAELTSLLAAHPEWGLRMETMMNLWNQKPRQSPGNFNRHLQRLSTHLSDPALQYEIAPKRNKFMRPLWTAAAAVLLIASMIGLYTHHQKPAQGLNTVSTRPGNRSKLQLPDGTVVWLNADSKLTYKIDDQNPTREVQLTGEAYFDVAKDKNHPFLIHTSTIDIRVLGTAFNVQCYGNERNTETSLFQGSVEVTLKNNPDKKIILRPNEKLIVHNNDIAVTNIKTREATDPDEPLMTLGKVHYQQKDSSYIETLWTKNQLAFDNCTLEQIANQIERWYDVKVILTDQKLTTAHFSGVFQDESLEQVMEALQLSGDFHYTIHKKVVTITP